MCDVLVVDGSGRVVGIGFVKRSVSAPVDALFIDGSVDDLCSVGFNVYDVDAVISFKPIPCLSGWRSRRLCGKSFVNVYEYTV